MAIMEKSKIYLMPIYVEYTHQQKNTYTLMQQNAKPKTALQYNILYDCGHMQHTEMKANI